MRILAIETATADGSVALLDADRLVGELAAQVPQRHLEWLAPAIDRLLHETGWRPAEVEAVAVSVGPGSFTGLRIGIATAVAWARARSVPLATVSTLEAIAKGVAAAGLVCPLLDARRGEVAGALFECNGVPRRLFDDLVAPVDVLLARLPRDRSVVFAGDALARYTAALRSHPRAEFAPPALWPPRASATGALAWQRLRRDERDDPYRVTPIYARSAVFSEMP